MDNMIIHLRKAVTRMRRRMQPQYLIPISFLLAIFAGALLLLLPSATAAGESTDFRTALFTATTSVCVTGLVTVDTFSHWSLLGKIIILVLIQIGGMGVIVILSVVLLMMGRKLSLQGQILLRESFNLETWSGLKAFVKRVCLGVAAVEGIGALLGLPVFVSRYGAVGIWYSVFHSISAFCNAGIDILGPDSLISYAGHPYLLTVTMLLIVLGGLGYVVWFDLLGALKETFARKYTLRQLWSRLEEHTRLVLKVTSALIIGGMLIVLIAEWGNPGTLGALGYGSRFMGALFQSVTFRTAGFAAVPQQELTIPTCVAGYVLMFIGGSPIGTAGGVKTVTMVIVLSNAMSYIRGGQETVLCGRRVSEDLIRKSAAIITVSLVMTALMTALLCAVSAVPLEDSTYEVVSALATVGLSRGLTPSLNAAGQWLIILCMFLGRVGPISMAVFFARPAAEPSGMRHADGRFYAG